MRPQCRCCCRTSMSPSAVDLPNATPRACLRPPGTLGCRNSRAQPTTRAAERRQTGLAARVQPALPAPRHAPQRAGGVVASHRALDSAILLIEGARTMLAASARVPSVSPRSFRSITSRKLGCRAQTGAHRGIDALHRVQISVSPPAAEAIGSPCPSPSVLCFQSFLPQNFSNNSYTAIVGPRRSGSPRRLGVRKPAARPRLAEPAGVWFDSCIGQHFHRFDLQRWSFSLPVPGSREPESRIVFTRFTD